jgi:hypothetical protein
MREHSRARTRAHLAGLSTEQVDQDRVQDAYTSSISNLYGEGFEGFADERDAFATRESYAQMNGYRPEDLLVGMDGMIMPVPARTEDRQGLTVEQLSHWSHWLDDADKDMRHGEDTTQYMHRLFATGVARGLVTSDGRQVDVWSKLGIDINNANDRRRVEGWLVGDRRDEVLSNTTFQSRNSAAEKSMLAAALKQRGDSSRKTVDLQTAAMLRKSIQVVRSDLSSKIATGDQGRLMVEELARELATAQNAGQQLAARDLAERLRSEVDSVTRSTFELAQELLTTQTDLLIGTGRLQGLDAIEKHLHDEMNAHIQTVKAVDEAMASVLNGREDATALLSRLGTLRSQVREQGAGLISEARRAGEYLDELHRQQRIDMGRVGDPTRSNSSIRKLVDNIGTRAFPVEERRLAPQRRRG